MSGECETYAVRLSCLGCRSEAIYILQSAWALLPRRRAGADYLVPTHDQPEDIRCRGCQTVLRAPWRCTHRLPHLVRWAVSQEEADFWQWLARYGAIRAGYCYSVLPAGITIENWREVALAAETQRPGRG